MTTKLWEHFPHQADIGIRGYGETLSEAFQHAGMALTGVITNLENVAPEQFIFVECTASDDEFLFFEWLNALIYEMATRTMLFSRFEVKIEGNHLMAKVWGEPMNRIKHKPAVEVKGATLTELRVYRDNSHWVAQTVVDV